jgi:hypothetical protein
MMQNNGLGAQNGVCIAAKSRIWLFIPAEHGNRHHPARAIPVPGKTDYNR